MTGAAAAAAEGARGARMRCTEGRGTRVAEYGLGTTLFRKNNAPFCGTFSHTFTSVGQCVDLTSIHRPAQSVILQLDVLDSIQDVGKQDCNGWAAVIVRLERNSGW